MKYRYLCLLALSVACAATVRPPVLNEVSAIASGSSAKESKELVPQAYLRAEKLRSEAEAAADAGKAPAAEVKAERAIAAYGHAQILARIVKAEQRLVTAKAELKQAQVDAMALEAKQLTIASELANLEKQVQLEQEAESIADTKASTPDREVARKKAAKTALTQARLLCVAASQLEGDAKSIETALANVTELDARVEKATSAVPLSDAIKARSKCLEQLTFTRRPARLATPNSAAPDELYLALSQAGYTPVRDDRGIVITFLDPASAVTKVSELAKLATYHDQTPLLLVQHASREPAAADTAQMESMARKLREAGVKSVQTASAGNRLPVESHLGATNSKQNERLEVVFVTRL